MPGSPGHCPAAAPMRNGAIPIRITSAQSKDLKRFLADLDDTQCAVRLKREEFRSVWSLFGSD
ncbi:hypothetical protein TSA1_24135 [Bradyrhizobium nitroreducens]|uniref:Uncharacterized protein n=1 Tax=Bradyrhizobium nitroreducens TaxID=709803 RepID=A0A2M6UG43_9BRAD|nr:hypothetical protein TSA1_24135 [Bradyrhizobium nitroreducens]